MADTVKTSSRVSVIETVYFQRAGEQANSVITKFQRVTDGVLGKMEQYPMTLGQGWVPIDLRGLTQVAQVVITNEEGYYTRRPTPEQHQETMGRVVEIGFGDNPVGDQLVTPRHGTRIEPADPRRIRLRCQGGEARVTITLFPG